MSRSKSPDEEGRQEEHEASFSGAAEYKQLSEIISPPVPASRPLIDSSRDAERLTDNEYTNALAFRRISQSVRPMFTTPDDPMREHEMKFGIGFNRRDTAMRALGNFRPSVVTEAERAVVYNMARYVRDTTPSSGASGNEAWFADSLRALEDGVFGPEGPEFVTETQRLHGEEEVFDWHGQPIHLFLGVPSHDQRRPKGTPDFQLCFRSSHEYPEGNEAGADLNWHLMSWQGEQIDVPPEGLTLGREMSISALEKTRAQLPAPVSRQHLQLLPQAGDCIRIVDFSTNGTEVREEYWQKRHQASEPTR